MAKKLGDCGTKLYREDIFSVVKFLSVFNFKQEIRLVLLTLLSLDKNYDTASIPFVTN